MQSNRFARLYFEIYGELNNTKGNVRVGKIVIASRQHEWNNRRLMTRDYRKEFKKKIELIETSCDVAADTSIELRFDYSKLTAIEQPVIESNIIKFRQRIMMTV